MRIDTVKHAYVIGVASTIRDFRKSAQANDTNASLQGEVGQSNAEYYKANAPAAKAPGVMSMPWLINKAKSVFSPKPALDKPTATASTNTPPTELAMSTPRMTR